MLRSVRRARSTGWFGVHASLAVMTTVAATSMGAVMISDSKKFAKGYVIRSSLLNGTVVKLHACARPSCATEPMWRPGQRRAWGAGTGTHLLPYAPSTRCHRCGRGDSLVECAVDEAAMGAALLTPFDMCSQWIREERPLRKPKDGWDFRDDPTKFPLGVREVTDPEQYL